ncbi:MAG: T9SS type A sorting domain-containing protein [Bacteroidales bacterium]|nr:T9SS type A sorting domain-containing protein [Bacteroidales bacterium]MCI7652876.1 T9SS type A sorting domain-containing protein [Bacteroidales bacterium]MDD7705162.1 T9SS type A sorting domain-containing protein [Bacteroidales bacterium]MDY4706192.1 T9SS type A sorting domain-containing protein [Prevotella sp.]MDY4952902.1 T9SS type A sorting domain-containing protein [Prevotella sp.]
MKQLFFLAMLMFAFTAKAQLTVFENGNVSVGSKPQSTIAKLTVGNQDSTLNKYDQVNLSSVNQVMPNRQNVAIDGKALSSCSIDNGRSIGVRGIAGNCKSGYNYGVFGNLSGINNGAGIYGCAGIPAYTYIDGKYAGYFNGDVKIVGGLKAKLSNSFDTKENGRYERNISNALGKIVSLNPKLNAIDAFVAPNGNNPELDSLHDDFINQNIESNIGTASIGAGIPNPGGMIYGYGFNISEVEKVFPRLIYTDDNGNKNIDYNQIIPILVKSIKELSEEVELLKETLNENNTNQKTMQSPKLSTNTEYNEILEDCKLFQNSPNPSRGNTTIKFELSKKATDAFINIYNNSGSLVKTIPVNSAMTEVTIQNDGLTKGIYLYTLTVNGSTVDTKRMVIAE